MNGINQVLKQAWQISQSPEVKKEDRLAALSLANNCYKFIMDLTTNGVVITDAIRYVQGQMDHLNTTEKKLLQDLKQKEEEGEGEGKCEEDIEEQKTTNGIF